MFEGTRKYGARWAAGALPTFHSMGVLVQLIAPLVSALPVGLYGPKYPAPPVVPNPQNVLDMTRRTGSDTIMTVPAFVEVGLGMLLCATFYSFEFRRSGPNQKRTSHS